MIILYVSKGSDLVIVFDILGYLLKVVEDSINNVGFKINE